MKNVSIVSAVVVAFVVGYGLGSGTGFERGERHAELVAASSRAEHDRLMRKVGVCSWAKVMAAQVQCATEFKAGEP